MSIKEKPIEPTYLKGKTYDELLSELKTSVNTKTEEEIGEQTFFHPYKPY